MATFEVDGTTVTFAVHSQNGFSREGAPLPRLQVTVRFDNETVWSDLLALLTTGFKDRLTLNNTPVLQVWAGPELGGTLTIANLVDSVAARLIAVSQNQWEPLFKVGSATFLLTDGATLS